MQNYERIEILEKQLEKAQTAITELQKYNPIRNDLDAYLYEIAEWGKGIREDKPNPRDYGINEDSA